MKDKVKEITDKIVYATIATVDENGQPWNSPVWSFHEPDLTYYWCSDQNSQHSKNIRANDRVFIVVYDSTVPEGTGEGVYLLAKASEIADSAEIARILDLQRPFKPHTHTVIEFQGEYPRRWYKATPEKIWINVDSEINGNFIDVRQEVKLP